LLFHGRWFSLGTPSSSTAKAGRHDIAEILLKVALSTKNQSINQSRKFTTDIKIPKYLFIFISKNIVTSEYVYPLIFKQSKTNQNKIKIQHCRNKP
jgi:hypothetical protein